MTKPAFSFPGVPLIHQPNFMELWDFQNHSEEINELAVTLHRDGFAVLDFPEPDFNTVADTIINEMTPLYDWEKWRAGGPISMRIQDAWPTQPAVAQIAQNKKIQDLLGELYGRRAFPFQTLTFAVGTQQDPHGDYVHFHAIPEQFMCGVWVALEDTDETNGALVYYPGSQNWMTVTNDHLGINTNNLPIDNEYAEYHKFIEAWEALRIYHKIEPKVASLKKGQAVIWTANVIHGGGKYNKRDRTRWSQVTHYFFDDCAYTTPLFNNPSLDKFKHREIYDISTLKPAVSQCCGEVINIHQIGPKSVVKTAKKPTEQSLDPEYLKSQRLF